MQLQRFLDQKPLYYDEIDYDRMPRAYASIRQHLSMPPIIHLVGTNGKGTTGRFLANALWRSGYRVGHYTSPHILTFNERIWLDGDSVDDRVLEDAHTMLKNILSDTDAEALSYFEYTTLLAAVVYAECDYVVMEAGLGGEHDATNVFEKRLSVFTPIGFDHQAFLGDTLEDIATTKFRSMERQALIAKQPNREVYDIFGAICEERQCRCHRSEEILQIADLTLIENVSDALHLPAYLRENLGTAVAALRLLDIKIDEHAFRDAPLFGRLSQIAENIWLDVGHNVLAAEAIAKALAGKQVILVYNTYQDKEYRKILDILGPIVKRVELIDVGQTRIESREKLEAALQEKRIEFGNFEGIDASNEYLVFGSFSVAEAFLKVYHE